MITRIINNIIRDGYPDCCAIFQIEGVEGHSVIGFIEKTERIIEEEKMKSLRTWEKAAVAASVVLLLGACSHAPKETAAVEQKCATCEAKLEQLKNREAQLASKERELQQKAQELEQQKAAAATKEVQANAGDLMLPPHAKPGECYARVWVPPKYKTVTEKVLKKEASSRYEVIPAKYKTVKKRVLVKEAYEKLKLVPAKYKWIEEKVLVKPAGEKIVTIPAKYKTVTEKVIDKPAHTVWKKGTGPIQRIDEATGEIMCLVEVPATYKTITRKVLVEPAKTKVIKTPPVYKTVKKRVVAEPEHTVKVTVPAQYKTITVTEMVSPPQTKAIEIPAVYTTVTRKEKISDGHMEWRSILCQTNMTRDRIAQIQRALKARGFDPGPIDGVIGPETMAAVRAFQRKNNLPVDKYLNIATVRALGVSPQ